MAYLLTESELKGTFIIYTKFSSDGYAQRQRRNPKLIAVVPTSTAAPGNDKSLESLMQQAAGVTSGAGAAAPATPDAPQVAPGSVPLKPSMGAIHGALGAAMPGARACVDPDDAISHAMVTFQSDGSVQSVSVSGGAAASPPRPASALRS